MLTLPDLHMDRKENAVRVCNILQYCIKHRIDLEKKHFFFWYDIAFPKAVYRKLCHLRAKDTSFLDIQDAHELNVLATKCFQEHFIPVSQDKKYRGQLISIYGENRTRREWSVLYNIPYMTFRQRLQRGWTYERALIQPVKKRKKRIMLSAYGETHTINTWSELTNLPALNIYYRTSSLHMPDDRAVSVVYKRRKTTKRATQYVYKGQSNSLYGWAKETGMNFRTLYARVHTHHWDFQKAIETPVIPAPRLADDMI